MCYVACRLQQPPFNINNEFCNMQTNTVTIRQAPHSLARPLPTWLGLYVEPIKRMISNMNSYIFSAVYNRSDVVFILQFITWKNCDFISDRLDVFVGLRRLETPPSWCLRDCLFTDGPPYIFESGWPNLRHPGAERTQRSHHARGQ